MKSLLRILCLTVAVPLLLASCTAAPSGDGPSVTLPSSKAGGASSRESDAVSSAAVTSDASSAVALADSSEAVTSSAASSSASSKASSLASSQAVSSAFVMPEDTRVINGKTYTLTFKDDFDGDKLDTSKWDYCPNWNRGNLNPPGRWDDSMVSVSDGCLRLGVSLDSNGVPISGAVRTLKKNYSKTLFSQCKGYFECRCQLQSATGLWGAFWLMSRSGMEDSNSTNGSVDGAEIDIFESLANYNQVNHAIHWDGYGSNHQSVGKRTTDRTLFEGFHTYGLAWTDTEYVFYVDGKEVWRTQAGGICNVPTYLKLTTECGTWAGTLQTGKLPDAVLVDYVRVWQAE